MSRDAQAHVDRVYKEHAARILAVLTRIFGLRNIELAEDVLQEAFRKALEHWNDAGVPDNPAAWIMQTAKHQAIDAVRTNKTRVRFAPDLTQHLESEWSLGSTIDQEFAEERIHDDQLRMIVICCASDVGSENLIPFVLRSLCGFTIPAVARALVLPEAAVRKRIARTQERLAEARFELPPAEQRDATLDAVHTVLYLMFNEGFHSSDAESALDVALCQEAMQLVKLVADEPSVANRDTLGLLALMYFHFARVQARLDAEGYAVPIDLQNRSLWNQEWIRRGEGLLERMDAARPGGRDRFPVEARIAREHCVAASFSETRWPTIVALYDELVRITDSPLAELTRWVAAGYAGQVHEAIAAIEKLVDHHALRASHLPLAALAHLLAKAGKAERARELAAAAKAKGGTPREHRLMDEQLERLLGSASSSS
ncbi:MAG: RNA polymerase sigma factor [Myxococcota bacterium]